MLKPKLILGTMRVGSWGANYGAQQLNAFLHEVRDSGIAWLDTADIYGNHSTNALIGAALDLSPELRSHFKLIGKSGILMASSPGNGSGAQHYNNSAAYLRAALDQMLRDLRVEQLAQFLIHRLDPLLDLSDLVEFVDYAVQSGKIQCFGVSNASLDQVRALARFNICANQLSFSLADRGVLDQLISYQSAAVALQAYSPLQQPNSEAFQRQSAELQPLYQLDHAQLAIAWLASIPNVMPVIGTTQIERVKALAHASDVILAREHWYQLLVAARGREME